MVRKIGERCNFWQKSVILQRGTGLFEIENIVLALELADSCYCYRELLRDKLIVESLVEACLETEPKS